MSYTETTIGFKPQKTADGNAQPAVVQKITVMPYTRRSVDLDDWRNASKAAESLIPRRVALYNLYHDISTTDGQVIAVWQKRIDAVTSAEWQFTDKDGNPVEEINQLIDCIGFDDLLTEIMNSKAWGYSMVEPTFFKNDNEQNEFAVYSIPKKHMRPERGVIAFDQHGDEGINIREGIYAKTIMEFGKPDDLGLFLSASMYAILKRGDISDWAEFIEIFGRGIIDAEWDGFDEGQRQKLSKAILDMGGGGVIIRPAGTKVDIKNNTGNANGDLQAKFADKMDAYISKVLLGSTETTDSSKSSGYAQAEIHQEQDEKKNETDLTFVRRYLNSRFIKVLKAHGFDTKGGTFVLKKTKKLNKEAYEVHKSMRNDLKVPIDDDFFYEEYGVRKPDNYDELKKALDDSENEDLPENTPEEIARTPRRSGKKTAQKPGDDKEELSIKPGIWRRLLRLFQPAPVLAAMPIAGACQCGEAHTIKLASIPDMDIKAFALTVWQAKGKNFMYPDLFFRNAEALLGAFVKGWQEKPKQVKLTDLGFEYGYTDPKIQTAWELNLFQFSAIKAAAQSAEVNALYRKTSNFDEFYRLVKKLYGVKDKQHLLTEWQTANAVGESAATYYRLLGQTKVFKYWRYMTQLDNKVRVEHQELHGITLPWDDPIWNKLFPPNGWGCRCYIVPVLESEVTEAEIKTSRKRASDFFDTKEWERSVNSGFGINRANAKEVFLESQQYSSTPDKVLNNVGQMYYDDWGMQPILDRQAKATETYTGADSRDIITQFYEKYKISSRKMVLTDYNNRDVVIEKNRLYGHTNPNNENYKDRYKYLPGLEDAIKNPDEVWINNDSSSQFDSYVYIKYYKNTIVKVICNIDQEGNLSINTWYNVVIKDTSSLNKENENDLYRHRRGLPVKK
ncbi:DUF935 family protein [Pedobacter sp. BS3]|uniref:phage portal protein family protein n=1 Tax=Pedobacter sp. BS3 TaxID=2567937 RepID=UPI0011ECF2FC|nr:DUF935 family protein [Pedobacter sp. BS3]TZF81809.1 DUF935 family protein [Pedobacter sp. BS3]